MSRKFYIRYHEWENDGHAHWKKTYYYTQDIFQKFTIRDIKEYVKGERYKIHEPICTCFLSIWKDTDIKKNQISQCIEYNDSIILDKTIFNELIPIYVCANLGKKCTCGELDKLILFSQFEKKREEDIKKWEEKSKEDKKYYDRRLREEKTEHQIEIKRLNNLIYEQKRENRQQMEAQNEQYKKEIDRIQKENNLRESQYLEEKKATKERFMYLETERKQERKEHNERLRIMENERHRDREEANKKMVNFEKERQRERELYTERLNTFEKELEENKQKIEEYENQKKLLK